MKSAHLFSKIILCSCSYITLMAMGVGYTTPARAVNATWSGISGSWFDSTNWSTGVVPDTTTTVTIAGAGRDAIIATGTANSSNATIDTGGEVDVLGAGAVWNNSGNAPGFNLRGGAIVIGDAGQGTLLIGSGGAVTTTGGIAGSILIGNSAGSTGVVTIGNGVGTSSLINAGPSGFPGNFYVGYQGTGTLNVNAGGSVSGFAGMDLGVETGSVAHVDVDGGSLDVSASSGGITVGEQGTGTVSVANSGQLTSNYGVIGASSGSSGSSVTVDGTGSAWNITGSLLQIGGGGNGALTLQNSGVVNFNGASNRVDVSGGTATGTLTIDDGQFNGEGASFYVGATAAGSGNATVENGGTLKTSFAYVGGGTFNSAGNGHVLVTGAGTLWDATLNASGVSVPSAITYLANPTGGSAVEVLAGAKFISGFTLIGNAGQPGATTQLTIDGSGSSWVSPYEDLVGYYGSSYAVGQTEASHGAVTISGGATGSSATMLVGVLSDSGTPGVASDSLTVTGAGSNFTVAPGNGFTGLFEVGYLGSGRATVSDGATMNSTRGIIAFTSAAPGVFSLPNSPAMNSFGNVLVTGTGSAWTIDTSLIVGDNQQGTLGGYTVGTGTSQGTLTISDGAIVSDASADVGANIRATGVVEVTGAGSRWTTTGNVRLGPGGGSGSLSLDDGATVSASDILVYSQGMLTTGTGTINSNVDGGAAGTGTFQTTEGTSILSGNVGASTSLGLVAVAPPTGNSSLTIDGSLNATTTAISQNGALTVGTGNAIGSVFSTIHDDGALIIDHSDDVTLNGSLSGSGNFNLQGLGTFTINGSSNPLTGLTMIEAGKLIVGDDTHADASLGSAISVAQGAALGGQGMVGATTVQSGGVIAPGNSIGTLHINGGYSQSAGAIFDVEVDPTSSNSDRIAVTGPATLANGAVIKVIKTANSPFIFGTKYTVLTTTSGLTGIFDPNASSFLGLIPSYDAFNAYLSVRTIASLGLTRNQRATGGGLDSLPDDNAIRVALQNLPSYDDVPAILDLLSGEIHASAQTALVEDSRFARDAATDRIRDAFCGIDTGTMAKSSSGSGEVSRSGASADCGDNADVATSWMRAVGSWARTDGNHNAATLDQSTGGFLAGVDVPVSQNWRVGGLAGYTRTNFDVDARNSSGSSDDYHVGAYGGTQLGALGFRTGAIYTWHDISTRRSVAFSGFSDSPDSDYHADSTQIFGDLGYRIDTGAIALEPFGNLAYVHLHTGNFDEKGGEAALHGQGDGMDTTFTTVGVRGSTRFAVGDVKLSANGSIGWRHAVGDVTPTSRLAFAGGDSFVVAGVPVARDASIVEAGLDMNIRPNTTLGISYNGQFGSHANDQGVRGTLEVKF